MPSLSMYFYNVKRTQSHKKSIMKFLKLILLLSFSNIALCQNFSPDSIAQLKKRFGFANMYFGVEGISTSNGSTSVLNSSNNIENIKFSGYAIPRLVWGGTHFWGHADFYVSFPIGGYKKEAPVQLSSLIYNLDVETGIKIYPYKLRKGALRPYIGMAWNISSFQQIIKDSASSIVLEKNTTPLLAGISYRSKRMIIETGFQYFFNNKYQYPLSKTVNGNLFLPKFAFTLGAKYLLETTNQKGAYIKKRMAALKKHNKYNAFYVGAGISASIGIPTFSEYDKKNYPFFENHNRYFGVIPDLTLGYYFSKPNMNVGISFRKMADSYQGFNVQHFHERKSIMLEAYKFLGDYHGFAPYAGITVSKENLQFATRDLSLNNKWNVYTETKAAVGVIFGWDIKPTKAESWMLRTNLRYSPLSMEVDNKKVAYNYIEFNFIQLVLFPERIWAQHKERKK